MLIRYMVFHWLKLYGSGGGGILSRLTTRGYFKNAFGKVGAIKGNIIISTVSDLNY